MNRREFLRRTISITVAGSTIAVILTACSDDDEPVTDTSTDATTDSTSDTDTSADDTTTDAAVCSTTTNFIDENHGHAVELADAELASGTTIVLSMTGGTHTHTVELSVADLESLAACQTVAVVSSSTGHTHTVTFSPVP